MNTTDAWIQEQVEVMAIAHFQGKPVLCPEDRTIVKVVELQPERSTTPVLMISCRFCGRSGAFDQRIR